MKQIIKKINKYFKTTVTAVRFRSTIQKDIYIQYNLQLWLPSTNAYTDIKVFLFLIPELVLAKVVK